MAKKLTPFRKKKIAESFQISIRQTGNINESITKVSKMVNEDEEDVKETVNEITIDLVDKFVVVVDDVAQEICDTEEAAQTAADSITNEAEGSDANVMSFDDAIDAGVDMSQVIELTPETDKIVLEIATEDIAEEIGKEIADVEADPGHKDVIDAVTDEVQEIIDAIPVDTETKIEIDSVEHTDTSDGISTFEIELKGDDADVAKVTEAIKSHMVSRKTRQFLKESALISGVKRLKLNETYKIESGIGGIMTTKYKGLKDGQHFFENQDKNFEGMNFMLSNEEVMEQVMVNESKKSIKKRMIKESLINEAEEVLKPIPTFKEFAAAKTSVTRTSERLKRKK